MLIGITGAGSMVGFHLAQELLEQKHDVIGVDSQKNKNIADLAGYKNFRFSRVDITELEKMQKTFNKVSFLYHLAAISSERLVKDDFPRALKVNVNGTANCLETARKNKAKLIYASSAAVYAHPENRPKESEATFPGKFYGTTKFIGEEFCRLYAKNFGLRFTALRFARIYGPRMSRNPVYDMSMAFSRKQPVKLYESPECEYDFVYVKDVVKALIMAQDDKWDNQEINISTGYGVTLKKIYEMFAKISGQDLGIKILDEHKSVDILNIDKATSLKWAPIYKLETGLKETLEYFSNLEGQFSKSHQDTKPQVEKL
jgi:UDP-glucose 4-epimerase